MHIGHVTGGGNRSSRLSFLIILAVPTVVAIVLGMLALSKPQVVVYSTTDFARLPVGATASPNPTAPASCAAIRDVNGSPKLVNEQCGSAASTFRVIGRVRDVAQCMPDADLTYRTSAEAVCLDYDWAANQCLEITSNAVAKVDCARRGAVQPEVAIVGAVDVTYCREGGIAHSVRHFTVCTLAGDKDCKGKEHRI